MGIRAVKPRIVKARVNDSPFGVSLVWGVIAPKSYQLYYHLLHTQGKEKYYTNNISRDFKILRTKANQRNKNVNS